MKKNILTLKKSTPSLSTQTPPLEESIISKANRADKDLTDNYSAWRDCLPLSLGIRNTLMLNYKAKYSIHSIRLVMKNHVSQPQYLQNIIDMDHRVNLQGEITHPITDKNKKHAIGKLKQLIQER